MNDEFLRKIKKIKDKENNIETSSADESTWELVVSNETKELNCKKTTETSRTPKCACCGNKMLLVYNKEEKELIDKINTVSKLIIPVNCIASNKSIASSKSAASREFKKFTELNLPIECKYTVNEYVQAKNYRICGSVEYEISKKCKGLLSALNGVCPYCGEKYDEATEDNIYQMCEKDYGKLMKKYKSKSKPESIDIDSSSFDYKEYLGTLVELYKDSIILEKQIRSFLNKKYAYRNAVMKEKGIYNYKYLSKLKTPKEYISSVKTIDDLRNQLNEFDSSRLSIVEKEKLWDEFVISNPEWKILYYKMGKPEKPDVPQAPPKPEVYVLNRVKPEEPTYEVANIFNKKRVEKENEELRKQYESEMAEYTKAYEEYERVTERREKKYTEKTAKYLDDLEKYPIRMEEYERQLKAFEEEENKRKEMQLQYYDTRERVYENAIQKKKTDLIEEIDRLQTIIDNYENDQKKERLKREQEVNALPSVVSGDMAGKFIEDEIIGMVKDLCEIYSAIDELQSMNVIYEKYYQFHSLCVLYEYFLSGRVSELGGPYGAYNLYESELKSDRILKKLDVIDEKLDIIIGQLDDIKESQLVLYKKMKEINTDTTAICKSMDELKVAIESMESASSRVSVSSNSSISTYRRSVERLPAYKNYTSLMTTQRNSYAGTVKRASVLTRGILGGILAGPAGAIVGALSAVDANRRK